MHAAVPWVRRAWLVGLTDGDLVQTVWLCVCACVPQVRGCGVLLTGGKSYCIKKRACMTHMAADAVFLGHDASTQYRFCQQCGKFEELAMFDGNRRCAGHSRSACAATMTSSINCAGMVQARLQHAAACVCPDQGHPHLKQRHAYWVGPGCRRLLLRTHPVLISPLLSCPILSSPVQSSGAQHHD